MNELFAIPLSNLMVASVFAVLAMMAGRWSRRPALTHSLWLLFFLKLLTPPLFPVSMAWSMAKQEEEIEQPQPVEIVREVPNPDEPVEISDAGPDRTEELENESLLVFKQDPLPEASSPAPILDQRLNEATFEFPWAEAVAGLWLTGSCCWFILAGARLLRFRRQLRFAQPASEMIQREARDLAGQLEVSCPEVLVLPGRLSPMLWLFGGKPRLLLPAGLLERLDETQRQALLVHELAHWRRRDHWVRRLELVALGLYCWCPLVWWARRHMQEAEEECCDAWVLWLMPAAARGYALALVETLDFMAGARPALPPVASGIGHVRLLQRRLTMIMRGTTPRTLTVGGGLAVLALGALLLPLIPSWAQSPALGDNVVVVQSDKAPGEPPSQPNDPFQAKRRELERAQKVIQDMQHELATAYRDMAIRNQELNRRATELQVMMERLQKEVMIKPDNFEPKQVEKKAVVVRMALKPGENVSSMPPDMDKRLREVERKLDLLIQLMNRQGQPAGPKVPGGNSAWNSPKAELFHPKSIDFGIIQQGESPSKTIRLEYVGTHPLNAIIKNHSAPFDLKVEEGPGGGLNDGKEIKNYLISATVNSAAAAGPFDQEVLLKTNDPDRPTMKFNVLGYIRQLPR